MHLPITEPLLLAAQGHDHVVRLPINIGPTLLRVTVLVAMLAVTGFAMLRPFLPPTTRAASAAVPGIAALAVLLSLMLAGGSAIPGPAVVLVLGLTAAPVYLALSRDKRFTTTVRRARTFVAPFVISASTAVAAVLFARGWLSPGNASDQSMVLYSATALALVGLSWYTVSLPLPPVPRIFVRSQALLLTLALIAGTTQATVLRLDDKAPSSASPLIQPI